MPTDTETSKPAWVGALNEAKAVLITAANSETPEDTDSKSRLAYAWMAIAKLLKGI